LEPFKLSDMSAAFFATGNVAISRRTLMDNATPDGPFDTEFSEYGWEVCNTRKRYKKKTRPGPGCSEVLITAMGSFHSLIGKRNRSPTAIPLLKRRRA
jgi:hypothetical protein